MVMLNLCFDITLFMHTDMLILTLDRLVSHDLALLTRIAIFEPEPLISSFTQIEILKLNHQQQTYRDYKHPTHQ